MIHLGHGCVQGYCVLCEGVSLWGLVWIRKVGIASCSCLRLGWLLCCILGVAGLTLPSPFDPHTEETHTCPIRPNEAARSKTVVTITIQNEMQ